MSERVKPIKYSTVEKAIQTELDQLSPAVHGPLVKYDSAYHQAIEKTVSRLNAFLRFLAKLSLKQYWEWMHKAFAQFANAEDSFPASSSSTTTDAGKLSKIVITHTPENQNKKATSLKHKWRKRIRLG